MSLKDFDGEPADGSKGADGGSGAGSGEPGATGKTAEEVRKELEAEFEKKLQSEADKRVTYALKKAEAKWTEKQAEKERQAKLSEEEREKEAEKQKTLEQAEKERLLNIKELKLELVDVLVEQGMDLGFKELINVESLLDAQDKSKALKEQVKAVKKIFDGIVDKKVEELKKEYLKGESPAGGKAPGSGADKQTAYEKAKAEGNVKEMIRLKFEARDAE
jgi:hypothetical protein